MISFVVHIRRHTYNIYIQVHAQRTHTHSHTLTHTRTHTHTHMQRRYWRQQLEPRKPAPQGSKACPNPDCNGAGWCNYDTGVVIAKTGAGDIFLCVGELLAA
jgi:hypothetical protein